MALACRSAREMIRGIKLLPEYNISSIIIPHQQLASVGVTILDLHSRIFVVRYYSIILGAHFRAWFYLIC